MRPHRGRSTGAIDPMHLVGCGGCVGGECGCWCHVPCCEWRCVGGCRHLTAAYQISSLEGCVVCRGWCVVGGHLAHKRIDRRSLARWCWDVRLASRSGGRRRQGRSRRRIAGWEVVLRGRCSEAALLREVARLRRGISSVKRPRHLVCRARGRISPSCWHLVLRGGDAEACSH